jgi:hypothetical protein
MSQVVLLKIICRKLLLVIGIMKLRPITSNIIDAPSEIVAKRLAYQFKQFPGPSISYVENTQDAIKKLQDIQIEDDEFPSI